MFREYIHRLFWLILGVAVSSVGIAMMLQANVGLEPWSVLQQGMALRTGMTYGTASAIAGAAAILTAVLFGESFGLGTIINIAGCAVIIDAIQAAHLIPQMHGLVSGIAMLIGGAAVIAVGANLLVDNGTLIAQALGVPESVIALTFVALGTSLPELVTAITSLIKGHGSLSLGNVIGANILNLVLVSGVASVLRPFSIPQEKMLFGMNASLVLDMPLMLFVMAFLTIPALATKKLHRYQGIVLLCIYAAFCVIQFTM